MAIIVKTSTLADGELLTASEKAYRNPHVCAGSLAYIWTSETASGEGLSSRGIVEECVEADRGTLTLRIRLVGGAPQRPLTKAMLAPHRDDPSGTAIAGLARKLYWHAHNKIVELSPDEAAYIDGFFEVAQRGAD